MKKGIQRGIQIILKIQLNNKFGEVSKVYLKQLENASPSELELIGRAIISANTIEEVFAKVNQKTVCNL